MLQSMGSQKVGQNWATGQPPPLWKLSLSLSLTHTHTYTGTAIHAIHGNVSHIRSDTSGQVRLRIHGWWTKHWARRPEIFISIQPIWDCGKSFTPLFFSCSGCKRITAISVHFCQRGHSSSGIRSHALSPSSEEEDICTPSIINNKKMDSKLLPRNLCHNARRA